MSASPATNTVREALPLPNPLAQPVAEGHSHLRRGRRDAATTKAYLLPVAMAIIAAFLVILAIQTSRSIDLIVALWGASGVIVAVWLVRQRSLQQTLSFAALAATGIMAGELLAGNRPEVSLLFTALNMGEILFAVFLTRRFVPTLDMSSVRTAGRFLLVTAIFAPVPSAALAAVIFHFSRGAPALLTFQTYWLGHALGLALIVPMILSFRASKPFSSISVSRASEWIVYGAALSGLSYAVLILSPIPLYFLLMPMLVLIAARLRVPGITGGLLIVTMIAIAALLVDTAPPPPVAELSVSQRIVMLQLMILVALMPLVPVAALLDERDTLSSAMKAARIRAERASAAKTRLLANVAHEIKSPVAGMIGVGELWSSGQLGPVNDQQKDMADMLVKTARQVERLAHDLLDVARAESGAVKVEIRPTDISDLLHDLRRAASIRSGSENILFEVECESHGLVALADAVRLGQVVDNLVTNAVKYGASGGVVLMKAYRRDDQVRIEVTDRGPGLSLEKQAQLFEAFNRLGLERSTIEGHGIGLALSRRLVELQSGRIGVISEPGQGSTFWVELPSAGS